MPSTKWRAFMESRFRRFTVSAVTAHGGPDINTQIEFMIPDSVVEPAVAVLQKGSTYR
jgi:hypothetical protein